MNSMDKQNHFGSKVPDETVLETTQHGYIYLKDACITKEDWAAVGLAELSFKARKSFGKELWQSSCYRCCGIFSSDTRYFFCKGDFCR